MKSGKELQKSGLTRKSTKFGGCLTGYFLKKVIEMCRFFKAKFKTKFNADVQVYAPYVYDAVKIMVAAMVKAGSSDPAKYLPVLAATKAYPGVTGPITFDEKGDIKNGALTLKTVKGGKLTEVAVIR